MEVLAPRGKAAAVSTEKAAKDQRKESAAEDGDWAVAEKPKVAERLVSGMQIAQMEKKVEEVESAADKAALKEGVSYAGGQAEGAAAVDQSVEVDASVEVAPAPAPAKEAKEVNGGNYVYKPRLHMEDDSLGGGSAPSRRAAKFEMQEEMFPDLAAAASGKVAEGSTGKNWSDGAGGGAKADDGGSRYSRIDRGGGDASRPGMGGRSGPPGGASGGGGMPDDNYQPGAARGRLKLAPRSKPVGE